MLMAISGKGEARPRAPPRKQSGRHVSARRMKSGDLGTDGLVPELGTLRRDPEPFFPVSPIHCYGTSSGDVSLPYPAAKGMI